MRYHAYVLYGGFIGMFNFITRRKDTPQNKPDAGYEQVVQDNHVDRVREFDLNIEKVLENWEVYHAIREIIANALDEQILTKTATIKVFFDESNRLHIRDYGRGIRYVHLTQNENEEKLSNEHLIGKFGVGLKDALATFDRHGNDVTIYSKYGVITVGKSKKHGFEDLITLHAYIDEPTDKNFVGTEFVITNCNRAQVEKAKSLFLAFSSEKPLETTPYGEVYHCDGVSCIFINGVKVAEEENFMFSYNITSMNAAIRKSLNRERTNVGRGAYSERVKSILLQCSSDEVINELIQNLNGFNSGSIKDEVRWSDVAIHAAKILNSKGGVVFTSASELEGMSGNVSEIMKSSGKTLVFLPENIKQKLIDQRDMNGDAISTADSVLKNYLDSFEYEFIPLQSLNDTERSIFSITSTISAAFNNPRLSDKVRISETIKPDDSGNITAGVWDSGLNLIIIRRDQLTSVDNYSGVLIHEMVHATTGLDDVSRSFESELTRIIGVLAGNVLRNGGNEKVVLAKRPY